VLFSVSESIEWEPRNEKQGLRLLGFDGCKEWS